MVTIQMTPQNQSTEAARNQMGKKTSLNRCPNSSLN